MSGTLYRDRDTPLPSIRVREKSFYDCSCTFLGLVLLQLTTDQHKTRNRDEQGRREEGERVAQLERNIVFLRQQHMETLQQLHSETEQLKRENRGQQRSRATNTAELPPIVFTHTHTHTVM